MVQYKINDKLTWSVDGKTQFVHAIMKDKNNNNVKMDFHGYIFGLVGMQKFKKDMEEHSVILITGLPGSGKSTFVEGIAALDSAFMGERLSMDDIAWSMDNLIKMMDSKENINRTIWADEFIQGTGRFNQSTVGLKLKIGFVTKRLKKNTYYLVVDEIKEFPEKVIKMADAYINIKKIGFTRGYFDCWVSPTKIYNLWKQFKEYTNTWNSPFVKSIYPDCKGKFQNYRGTFLDVVEFDRLKIEQTQQGEANKKGDKIPINAMIAYNMKKDNPKMSLEQIGLQLGVHSSTVSGWIRKINNIATTT